eukprot:5111327-Alexandrium_andersonii.AAC.1
MPSRRTITRPYRRTRRAAPCAAHLHAVRGIVETVAVPLYAAPKNPREHLDPRKFPYPSIQIAARALEGGARTPWADAAGDDGGPAGP